MIELFFRFVHWLRDYTFRKAIADAIAAGLIVLAALTAELWLLRAFVANSGWTSAVWSSQIAPRLPKEVAFAGDAFNAGRVAALTGQKVAVEAAGAAKESAKKLREVRSFRELFSGSWLSRGDSERSPKVEAWTRLLLLGEAWILKIQLSLFLRFPFLLRRLKRRFSKTEELRLQPQF